MATRTYTTQDLDGAEGLAAAEPSESASTIRSLALGGAAAGAIGIAAAIVNEIVAGSTDVSDEVWSYPWSGGAFVVVSLVFSLLHVLTAGAILALRRSGLAGSSRGATTGTAVAIAGTVVVICGELLSIPTADFDVESTTAVSVLIPLFASGGLMVGGGMIAAGRATLKAGRWDGPGRFAPLAFGVAALAPTLLGATDFFEYGFMLYGAALLALGLALARRIAPGA